MTVGDYLQQLQALLPRGAAWTREPGAVLTGLLEALAGEYSRADIRAGGIIDETDPRTVFELLEEWEAFAGLPDSCVTEPATLAGRRAVLLARLTAVGGQSPAYYIAAAALYGYAIEVAEYAPFVAGSAAGDALTNGDWGFAWVVISAADTVTPFRAGGQAGEALASWGNSQLECLIRRLRPAHTHVIFSYQ